MNRPWHQHYVEKTPTTLEVPRAPLTAFLDEAVARFPDRTACHTI